MSQQPSDKRDEKDPYPADQQFGQAAAEDQDRVDRGEEPERSPDDAPRAANKAEPE